MPVTRYAAVSIGLAASVVTLAGCSSSTAGPFPDIPTETPVFDALATPEQVPVKMREELGEDVTVRRITLTNSGFLAEVRDPAKPDNMDRYTYFNNTWDTDPISVSVSDIADLDKTTFGLGAIDWKVIPELERKALAGLDLEDEEVTSVSTDRITGNPPRIYVSVNGARGSGGLTANARGGDVEVRRY